ncbi:hypothetical protein H920_03280 [Fukomys damarensis]|uniref:Uncharacterized protein n=1 Tax=Fukomys damarensis TaxID=885580 RepID=A0A091DWD7_FUKDA|nr:hypothetical protein H920_03280 [Fukomys damarensis]
MANAPKPRSGSLSVRPTPQRSRYSRHFRVRRPKPAGWETSAASRLPSAGDQESGYTHPVRSEVGIVNVCERLRMPECALHPAERWSVAVSERRLHV